MFNRVLTLIIYNSIVCKYPSNNNKPLINFILMRKLTKQSDQTLIESRKVAEKIKSKT